MKLNIFRKNAQKESLVPEVLKFIFQNNLSEMQASLVKVLKKKLLKVLAAVAPQDPYQN